MKESLAHLSAEGGAAEEAAVLAMLAGQAELLRWAGFSGELLLPPGEACCATVHGFKGLKRPVILLVGIESWLVENVSNLLHLV